jgi:vitamin B12 transporter
MRISIAGSLSLLFFSSALHAAELAKSELERVVVTATRTGQSPDEILSATTVLTRSQIESSQARSIEDLLLGVEGISITNSGGPGKLTSFFVRGTDADHLMVLVDGIRVGSATAGSVALQNLPLEQIERIEFVRGPRSSLYGSEAVGGVLQVFTRRGGGPLKPEFSISGGSYGTVQGSAALQGGGERTWFSLQGSAQSVDGFDACRGSSTEFAGCFTEEPDDDASDYSSVAVRGGYRFGADTRGTEIEGSFWRADSKVDYDGSFVNRSEITQQVAGVSLVHGLRSGGRVTARAGRAWDISDDFIDTTFTGDFETQRDTASLQLDLPVASAQVLTLGVDYQDDEVSGSTDYEVSSRNDVGLFAQYVASTGPWRVEGSLRGDDNEQFGDHLTGGLGVGFQFSPSWGLLAQYGTGFRAPTFNDLYYPFFGNPDLEPEESRSAELAARGQSGSMRWRVSLFDTEVSDLIGFDANFAPANIDAARILGMEAGVTLAVDGWTIDAGLTLLDPENRSAGPNEGNQLPRRPEASGKLDIERRFQKFTLGARLASAGSSYDDAANLRRVPGYTLVDLRGEYQMGEAWRVQARIANLLDSQYETIAFYNQPGRAAYLTLRYGK